MAKNAGKGKKRSPPQSDDASGGRKMPRHVAACSDFKEKSAINLSGKSSRVETKKEQIAEEEIVALHLTPGPNDGDRSNRKLNDFILHDENGVPQLLEMLEVNDLFITGNILPLDEASNKEKEKGKGRTVRGFRAHRVMGHLWIR